MRVQSCASTRFVAALAILPRWKANIITHEHQREREKKAKQISHATSLKRKYASQRSMLSMQLICNRIRRHCRRLRHQASTHAYPPPNILPLIYGLIFMHFTHSRGVASRANFLSNRLYTLKIVCAVPALHRFPRHAAFVLRAFAHARPLRQGGN